MLYDQRCLILVLRKPIEILLNDSENDKVKLLIKKNFFFSKLNLKTSLYFKFCIWCGKFIFAFKFCIWCGKFILA